MQFSVRNLAVLNFKKSSAPFRPFFDKLGKYLAPDFSGPTQFFRPLLCLATVISAPWQHWRSTVGHQVEVDSDFDEWEVDFLNNQLTTPEVKIHCTYIFSNFTCFFCREVFILREHQISVHYNHAVSAVQVSKPIILFSYLWTWFHEEKKIIADFHVLEFLADNQNKQSRCSVGGKNLGRKKWHCQRLFL
jgi:hypothetical protein